jgi:hypothetical protein
MKSAIRLFASFLFLFAVSASATDDRVIPRKIPREIPREIPMMRVRDDYRPQLVNEFKAVVDVKTGNLLGMSYKKMVGDEFKSLYSDVEQTTKGIVLSEVHKLGQTFKIVQLTTRKVDVSKSAEVVIDYRKDSLVGKRGSFGLYIARSGESWAIYASVEAFNRGDLPLNDLFFKTGDRGIKGVSTAYNKDVAEEFAKRGGAIK